MLNRVAITTVLKWALISSFAVASTRIHAQTPNVSGAWTFSAQSDSFGLTFTASGEITQSGSSVSGMLTYKGNPCSEYGTFSGTLTGNTLTATVVQQNPFGSPQNVYYKGTVSLDGSSASGTYTSDSGPCTNSDHGTWTGSGQLSHPFPVITGVSSLYSNVPSIESGSWITIYGMNLASGITTWNGDFPIGLGGTAVSINNRSAYLWYVSPTQLNVQVPDLGSATGTVTVVVATQAAATSFTVTLSQFAPSFSQLAARGRSPEFAAERL